MTTDGSAGAGTPSTPEVAPPLASREAGWYRQIGDTYLAEATHETLAQRKTALLVEAAKHHGIADRMEASPESAAASAAAAHVHRRFVPGCQGCHDAYGALIEQVAELRRAAGAQESAIAFDQYLDTHGPDYVRNPVAAARAFHAGWVAALVEAGPTAAPPSDELAAEVQRLRRALAGHLFDGESLSAREAIRSELIKEGLAAIAELEQTRADAAAVQGTVGRVRDLLAGAQVPRARESRDSGSVYLSEDVDDLLAAIRDLVGEPQSTAPAADEGGAER